MSSDTAASEPENTGNGEHGHSHDSLRSLTDGETGGDRSTRRLGLIALINFVGFLAELAGGLLFGSMALLSDAVHMLFDMLAYVMAFGASYTAERFDRGERWSYGLHRLEPVAAFLNGVLLLPMVGYIVWESYKRFLEPVGIDPVVTLVIATGGLVVNVASVLVVHSEEMNLNERGAYYHLLGDAGGSVAVIVAVIAVWQFSLPVADPAAAVLIAVLILISAGTVLGESSGILLQRSPVSIADLRSEITALEGVDHVEDLHVWQVCSELTVGTVRIADTSQTLDERAAVRQRVHDLLAGREIQHATVEFLDGESNTPTEDRSRHEH